MIAKTFEVRDAATFLPVLAVKLEPGNDRDRYLLARTGYGRTADAQSRHVMVWGLTGGTATYDVHEWGNRTRRVAHEYIVKYFDRLDSGCVIDVEHLLGLRSEPKRSEAESAI